jgi:hypothetical protein
MKRIVMGLVAGFLFACSSGSGDDPLGPDPDPAAIESHFQNPDGTFNEGNAQRVLNGQGAAAEMNVTGSSAGSSSSSSSGTSTKQSALIHILDTSGNDGFACAALQQGQESGNCACPDGGSFDYAVRRETVNQTTDIVMKMKLNACTVQGASIDGREYMKMHVGETDGKKPDLSMLLVIDATVTKAGETKSVLIEQRLQNGVLEIAIRVDDGWVAVRYESASSTGGTQSGKLIVRDRRGTWTCVSTNGHGECTSDKGETQKF